ncbi:hypothetical protein ACQKEX_15145 [Bacillus pumilus]|uniref:hypothetical protein n=2 Tax=Bacillus TaxID=1386 RepID=UPI00095C3D50|nr:hypothetical protein [Bacillus pumilus]MBU8576466.1 hypothetical protein [Bacillus pumilus]OLP64334.1 hypothetical protein BACPU_25590 [Bacillus pumilus]
MEIKRFMLTYDKASEQFREDFHTVPTDLMSDLMGIKEVTELLEDGESQAIESLPKWQDMYIAKKKDAQWIKDNVTDVINCGYRVFQDNKYTYLGLDIANSSELRQCWIDLYKLKGYMWHDPALNEDGVPINKLNGVTFSMELYAELTDDELSILSSPDSDEDDIYHLFQDLRNAHRLYLDGEAVFHREGNDSLFNLIKDDINEFKVVIR